MRLKFAIVMTALLPISLSAHPAFADTHNSGWTNGGGIGAETSNTSSGDVNSGGGSNGGAHSNITCSYLQIDESQIPLLTQNANPSVLNNGKGVSAGLNLMCVDSVGNVVSITPATVGAAPTPAELAQQAFDYRTLPIPAITLSPAVDRPQLVNLPTWLSVSPATWKPTSASASAAGVNVTTTATPISVTWTTGDGGSVTCNGPGALYDTTKPDSSQRTDCSYVYRSASTHQVGGSYTLTATVHWRVGWTATGVPPGVPANGALNGVDRTASVRVQVNEVQTLNQLVR